MDKELEKRIVNCSRCGLCMEVCPVYKVKKTETSVSRGKFLQLLGLIRKELKFDKRIKYNLDLCTNCDKCKKACPSDIDAVKIFASVICEYQSPLEEFLNSSFIFKLKIFCLKVMYKIKYPIGRKNFKKKPYLKTNEKIAHFNGCVTRAINNGFEIPYKFEKENFVCCALPFYVKGRFNVYEKYKNRNIELMKKYDKVVFDCAGCFNTVMNYEGVDKNKLVYFTDFYKNKSLYVENPVKITFHKPCHLDEDKFLEIEKILMNIEGVSYLRMNEYSDCCGFGGDFFTRHINTASILSSRKIENAAKTGSNIVLTTCPACLWSLKFGIKTKNIGIKAYDLADFLHNFVNLK